MKKSYIDTKILFYGAGVIGTIFAGMIARKGYDVTVLARGKRLLDLEANGLVLVNALNKKRTTVQVKTTDVLNENDVYNYVIVAVQNTQIDDILPVLSKNKSPNIVFVVNNPLGYNKWIDAVGRERVMIGFPSAGGARRSGEVHYFIGKDIAKLFQSTTFGELDGVPTERLSRLVEIFRHAGFQPSVSKAPDAWQKTHLAVVLPFGKALYRYQSDNYALSRSYVTLKNAMLGVREMFRVLKSIDVHIEPKKLYFFYLPVCILVPACKLLMNTRIAEYAMAQHTIVAKEEMDALEEQFLTLNARDIDLKYYKVI
jgi:2-dehydropantoate 2-reductase